MKKQRVRPLLLGLLWVWAFLMFVLVDLFKNVPEFDRARPTAPLYRGMRVAAHRLVGEPIAPTETAPPAPAAQGARASPRATSTPEDARRRRTTPTDLAAYGRAASRAAAADDDPERSANLALAALEAHAETLHGRHPSEEQLRAARISLERIAFTRDLERSPRFSPPLAAMRVAVGRALETVEATERGVEVVRLALLLGDERTADACLRLLRDEAPRTREEQLLHVTARQVVMERGTARQRLEARRRADHTAPRR